MSSKHCRFCRAELRQTFVDLGRSPLANSLLSAEDVDRSEALYPLHVFVCDNCLLVQLPELARAEAQRALTLAPNYADAKQLLERMQTPKQSKPGGAAQ